MCYKDEVQRRNSEKLQNQLDKDKVPMFIRSYLFNKRSKLGSINYWCAIKDLLLWLIEKNMINKKSISEIIPEDMKYIEAGTINTYFEEKEMDGISPTTLYTRKNIFRSFWEAMVDSPNVPVTCNVIKNVAYEGLDSNCTRYVKMPKESEIKEMEENIKKKNDDFVRERNLIILTILKETGLRECELSELEFSSLFLDGSKEEKEESPFIKVMGKGVYRIEKARNVLLSGTAKRAFLDWFEIRNKMENIVDKKAIFLNKNGKRLSEYNISSIFKTYSKGKITPHMMRHWYLSEATQKYGAAFAQQQAGHKSSSITVNTYIDGGFGIREKLAQS